MIPGQLSIEFINVGGWLTSGDLAMDSCAQFVAVAEHRLIPSWARSIGISFVRLDFILFGLLPVRIELPVAMLGLVLLVLVVLLYLFHPLSLLSFKVG